MAWARCGRNIIRFAHMGRLPRFRSWCRRHRYNLVSVHPATDASSAMPSCRPFPTGGSWCLSAEFSMVSPPNIRGPLFSWRGLFYGVFIPLSECPRCGMMAPRPGLRSCRQGVYSCVADRICVSHRGPPRASVGALTAGFCAVSICPARVGRVRAEGCLGLAPGHVPCVPGWWAACCSRGAPMGKQNREERRGLWGGVSPLEPNRPSLRGAPAGPVGDGPMPAVALGGPLG